MFRQHAICADVLRLDKIHPEISGNKWFKLKYHLEKAKFTNKNTLVSFGGAYSNHLLALAAAARINGFSSIGFIRGEEPTRLSHTLLATKEYGMALRFLSRPDYDQKKKSVLLNNWGEKGIVVQDEVGQASLLIPEGGAGMEGIRGAEEILSMVPLQRYTHICTAVGTGTTLAGLINSAGQDQKLIGVSVLKGTWDFE